MLLIASIKNIALFCTLKRKSYHQKNTQQKQQQPNSFALYSVNRRVPDEWRCCRTAVLVSLVHWKWDSDNWGREQRFTVAKNFFLLNISFCFVWNDTHTRIREWFCCCDPLSRQFHKSAVAFVYNNFYTENITEWIHIYPRLLLFDSPASKWLELCSLVHVRLNPNPTSLPCTTTHFFLKEKGLSRCIR